MEHLLSHYHDQGYIQQQQQEYEQHLYEIDDPELFMKTIKDKDFSERKHTLCKYDWNTRFMKLNSSKTTMELPSISPSR